MERASEKFCAWSGIAFAVIFFIGFVGIARFFPPLSPADTAEQTAAIYREHTNAIRTGLLLCYIGTMFYLAFGSGIVGQTRRIRGAAPAITFFQISSYASAVLLIILPLICWFTAAFRPDEWSPESVRLMNDLGWIGLVIGFSPFVTWVVTTSVAILSDRAEQPLYPRWSGISGRVHGIHPGHGGGPNLFQGRPIRLERAGALVRSVHRLLRLVHRDHRAHPQSHQQTRLRSRGGRRIDCACESAVDEPTDVPTGCGRRRVPMAVDAQS